MMLLDVLVQFNVYTLHLNFFMVKKNFSLDKNLGILKVRGTRPLEIIGSRNIFVKEKKKGGGGFFDRSLVESGPSFVVVIRNILSVIYPTLGVFCHLLVLDKSRHV